MVGSDRVGLSSFKLEAGGCGIGGTTGGIFGARDGGTAGGLFGAGDFWGDISFWDEVFDVGR